MSETPDPIPLSALNQYAYCPRRCFLIHVEGEFADNVHTVSGTLEHERVDTLHHEIKAGVRVEFAVPVWSERLGLSGRCDVVEVHPDGTRYPVEYKHGKRRQWLNDDLQLAGQALCLAEMTGRPVPKGAIFHTQSKRRREVEITPALAALVRETADAVRALFGRGTAPPPVAEARRCGECSLQDLCRPDLLRAAAGLEALAAGLFEPEEPAGFSG
jgi:CRISPR-associated exonuclease Cas4